MNITVENVKKFIEDSVNSLLTTDYTCCRYELDNDLAFFIGWDGGFSDEEDDSIYQDTKDKTFAICMKIANTREYVWADYEFNYMPYYKDTGDLYDTNSSIPRGFNGNELAKWYIKEYKNILRDFNDGLLVI